MQDQNTLHEPPLENNAGFHNQTPSNYKAYSNKGICNTNNNNLSNIESIDDLTNHPGGMEGSADVAIETPLLNSIPITDTIMTLLDNQIEHNVYDLILQRHHEEAIKDRRRSLLELVRHNQIMDRQIAQRHRALEEDERFEQLHNEEMERKQSLLRDTHCRHAQALNKRHFELLSRKQNEESLEREKTMRKEEEENRVVHQLEEENSSIYNYLTSLMARISEDMSGRVCDEAMAAEKRMKDRVGRLMNGDWGVGNGWGDVGNKVDANGGRSGGRLGHQCAQLNSIYKETASELERFIALESERNNEISRTATATTTIPLQPSTKATPNPAPKNPISTQCIEETTISQCQTSYLTLLKTHHEVKDQCKLLNNDPKYKRYRFDLTAAIGRIISTLNSQQGSKMASILQLLEGEAVVCSGTQKVSTKEHPVAALFCMDKLAKKIVDQATETSKINSDLYVSLSLQVAASKPFFTLLLLTHFALVCPITVPYMVSREGKTDEDYYRFMGYGVDDSGALENENTFLLRVSSYVSLFATLLVAGKLEGFSLKEAWVWLSRVLNQTPVPGVTATALHKFLSIVERQMFAKYRRQYVKVLRFICDVFVERIDRVSDSDKKAPVMRLQIFVRGALRGGGISAA